MALGAATQLALSHESRGCALPAYDDVERLEALQAGLSGGWGVLIGLADWQTVEEPPKPGSLPDFLGSRTEDKPGDSMVQAEKWIRSSLVNLGVTPDVADGLVDRLARLRDTKPQEPGGPFCDRVRAAFGAVCDAAERRLNDLAQDVADELGRLGWEGPVALPRPPLKWLTKNEAMDWQNESYSYQEDVEPLIHRALHRCGEHTQARKAAAVVPPCLDGEVWLPIEVAILKALYYQGHTLDELAGFGADRRPRVARDSGEPWSYSMIRKALRPAGKLRRSKIVDNKRGLWYHRIDAPPGQRPQDEDRSGVNRV